MTNPGTGLKVAGLTVRYGAATAVEAVDLEVAAGEIVALVGPSGSGKSTLLRAVAGLETPVAGSITWDGDDLAPVPTHERDIGLMFQDHALFTHRSVADNVGFGLKMKRWSAAARRARVDELLALVALEGFGDRSVGSLSGGEAQRVALARALAPSPRVLLLDEPLGSLDRVRREQLVGEIRSVLREVGQTAVHVTHDQEEAFGIGDRVAVMRAGRIVRVGAPADVWADPRDAFTAGFLGHTVIETSAGLVAIRSDGTQLAEPDEGSAAAADTLGGHGRVLDVRFRGDRSVVTVITDDGREWAVLVAGDVPLAGDRVRVVVDPNKRVRVNADLT